MVAIQRKLERETATVVGNRHLVVRLFPDHLELSQRRKRTRVSFDYAALWVAAQKRIYARSVNH